MIVTRFAPSPSGYLHVGHAYSAFFAYRAAMERGGRFLLRIEDIDSSRCRPEFTQAIYEDLRWLGLSWEEPVRVQAEHLDFYKQGLDYLRGLGLIYPCFCTRAEIAREAAEAVQAPHALAGEVVYPGTCCRLSNAEREAKLAQHCPHVWRLSMNRALAYVAGKGRKLIWHDESRGEINANPARFGDVVLARKDVATSYHLSVVMDDALQGVTLVTRGEDLFDATDIHCLLQSLFDYPTPLYHHHKLLTDVTGRRYAKRDKAQTLRSLRETNVSAEEVRAIL